MSIDTHEEPWLREALDGLVSGEPSMTSTLVDDVRRGETARTALRRRRLATVAVAAVLALVAVPAALLLRAQPHAATPPATSTSATPEPTVDTTPPQPIPSPTTDGFVADAEWEAGAIAAFSGGITTVFQHADPTAAMLNVSGREAEGDVGRFVMVRVDQGSTAAALLASPPCGIDDPTCRVLLPWGRVTTQQGPAWISVVDVSYTDPVHRTRVASVVRGDTTVMVSSDSREVSTDFTYGDSTAPGLSPDIIVERALAIPVPESMRAAAGKPMSTPPDTSSAQGGSASASADPGVAALRVCDVASLYITVGPAAGVSAGQQAFAVHLSYNGGQDCQLPGSLSLGLTASDTADVTPVGGGRQPGSGAASPLRLAPGSRAVVTVSATRCTGVVTAKTTFMSLELGTQAGGVVVPREVALDYCEGAAAPGGSAVRVSPPVLEP